MKTFTLIFAALLGNAKAFQVVLPPRSTSALRYTIIGAPDEEVEQDPQSVGYNSHAQHHNREAHSQAINGGVGDLSSYRDYDEVLEDEDHLNVDSFSHTSGANIMPGFHLTALCGDD